MRGPLSVRINDGQDERVVTRFVSGLKYSKVANGGHKAASMRLNMPPCSFSDLGPADRVWVDNTATGGQAWSGYTQNPSPSDGPGGQGFELSALGGMILAADETRSLIYVSRDLSNFEKENIALASSNLETGPWENDKTQTRLRITIPGGTVVGTGQFASAVSDQFARANTRLGGIRIGTFYGGKSDADYAIDFTTPTGIVIQVAMNAAYTLLTFVGDPNFPSGTDFFALKLRRTGPATNVADDLTWAAWANYSVVGQRVDRFGNLLIGAAGLRSAQDVRASEVVEDLLGRVLKTCDPDRSTVVATTMPINQFAFPDGATAQRILDELDEFEPDMRWGIGTDGGVAGGRGHEFWYAPWDPEPRYEITSAETYRQTGSEVDLCNRVSVAWVDEAGDQQVSVVTATAAQYPALLALEASGRIRDADPITLPEGKGSANNALTIGTLTLADKASPPRSGTAVVARYVRDLHTGALVHPCEIEPGFTVLVRSTGETLRCTETEYDDDAGATQLTLGTPILTESQRLARTSVV